MTTAEATMFVPIKLAEELLSIKQLLNQVLLQQGARDVSERKLLDLSQDNLYSCEELAKVMKCSPQTVKNYIDIGCKGIRLKCSRKNGNDRGKRLVSGKDFIEFYQKIS